MEDYEQELYGIEDDFHNQFAAELEVLAELEGAEARLPASTPPPPAGRPRLTFEEAISRGDIAPNLSPTRSLQKGKPNVKKRELGGDAKDRLLPPSRSTGIVVEFGMGCKAAEGPQCVSTAPRIKRPRLEAVKRLNFGPEEEPEDPPLDSPPKGITPPPSPDLPAELYSDGFLHTVAYMSPTSALPAAHNPVLRRPPVLEDYINVTSTNGDRAFLVLRADPTGTGVQSPLLDIRWRGQLDLLGMPFTSLKEQVDDERRQRLLEEAQRLSEVLHSLRPEEEKEATQLTRAPEEVPEAAEGQDTAQHCLWVDEFAPRQYTELLSDDFTNRCLLKWLKLWDLVVFGRETPARKPRPGTEAVRASKEAMASSKWKSHEQVLEEMLEAELDTSRRPRQKVALLCGPPGLGKTTLAHVIAWHAGYCVVEMNASDDRSPEAFRTRIEAATQMESVLGAGGRPNCLIIDEIDGAPTAAINVLLSILDRKGPQDVQPGAQPRPAGGMRRRQAEGGLLMRPIICICNNQFVPSLRQLKQQALLLHFPPTLPSRLVQRLQEITRRQGMQADPGALAALCEKTDNDIRACINTLQFLHGQGRRELSVRAVQTTRIGLKDKRKGLFAVWQEVFQLPRAQRRCVGQELAPPVHALLTRDGDSGPCPSEAAPTSISQRFQRVLHVASSAGEHEKVVQGLYDNFLRLRLRDPTLGAVCAALDWLAFDDLLAQAALHGQSFQLLCYPPVLPAAFHLLFAAVHVPHLAFPSSQQEAQNRTSQTQNLIQTLVSGITPSARSRATPQTLVLDALCPLLDILTPKLRPVSTQLYSTREKQQLAGLVGTMLAYNLTYRQERMADGQYTYRLEPNLEGICRFPELPVRKPLTYQAKQLIAREIEVEKMRRAEPSALAAQDLEMEGTPPETEGVRRGEDKGVRHSVPRNHEQRLEYFMRKATFEEQPERDFFGRIVVRSAATSKRTVAAEDAAPGKDSAEWRVGTAVGRSHVWFRFNEGVSNAVRRNVHIKDLL
ncbi:PREDICTED: chromosome transmission fidelity protein 18 homolog [Elephantulus edwardii]|uniref:chromosome transmission fidelity protein 18 homolog n=1 Tax=Elephantulus edwardii TaxID=28737 RepID=UPI0003F0D179|nr:PREDICTED: chromosome transmission fidelity protein 18 homolog [Elephantulus edwardii]